MGFNNDAVILSVNDFGVGSGFPAITTIEKSSILDANPGTLVAYNSTPAPNFRAMVPAQMHGATAGLPMYFIQERSYGDGSAIQVVTMTDYLSNSPTFDYANLLVQPYLLPPAAQQPGGSAATNDTTFTQLDWRGGKMTAAHTVGVANDYAAKVRWYQIDTTLATPSLIQQGTIDPGPGISTYFGSVVQDAAGNLGATYMQSSSTEFISMYIAGQGAGAAPGTMTAGVAVGIGTTYNFISEFRNGDYSGLVVDPSDGATFWAANEYAGSDFLWNTKIASFEVGLAVDSDWYNIDVAAGSSLTLTANVPASGSGEFVNNLVPRIELYNSVGGMLGSAEGVGAVLTTGPLSGGTYSIRITSVGLTGGEYVVAVSVSAPGMMAPAAPAMLRTPVVPSVAIAQGVAGLANPVPNVSKQNRIDLLSAVVEEFREVSGFDRESTGEQANIPAADVRRARVAGDYEAFVDQVFGQASDQASNASLGVWLKEQFE